ncbi:MAG TPA: hypothetical protein VFI70_12025 [Nitrososphaeraceae archaeon]|nr:hypothetical protein [Nitrososphaeraceae archaeon]
MAYKLRIRISILLGVYYDANYLFNFMNESYKIRSKLVHGKVDKNAIKVFEIQGKKFGLYDVANELEGVTRLSILEMLSLLKHYNYRKQEDLINAIDKVATGISKKLRPSQIHS